MANTLTGLIPVIYEAMDIVSRELVGFINAVFRDSSAERAAVGQDVSYHIVPAATTGDIVPGQQPPDDGDQVIDKGTMTISKSKYSPIRWSGEEQRSVTGQYRNILRDQFAQSMRAICNLAEVDVASTFVSASRAFGTAGTAPFGTAADLSDFAGVNQILDDNGAPTTDRRIVVSSPAMANLRGKQSVLFKLNEAGTDELLRKGTIGEVQKLAIGYSGQIGTHTKGTGAAYVTSGSTAVGVTGIALVTGTGTVLAGDVVTFAADAVNKYVIGTGIAAPGTIQLGKPGARVVIATANAMTIGANHRSSMCFHRMAIHLVTRSPAMPEGGDEADDVMEVTDPHSGLTFQVALYRLYRRIKIEIGLAWGWKAVKAEHIALLLG